MLTLDESLQLLTVSETFQYGATRT